MITSCEACGGKVSLGAIACPHCGHPTPIGFQQQRREQEFYRISLEEKRRAEAERARAKAERARPEEERRAKIRHAKEKRAYEAFCLRALEGLMSKDEIRALGERVSLEEKRRTKNLSYIEEKLLAKRERELMEGEYVRSLWSDRLVWYGKNVDVVEEKLLPKLEKELMEGEYIRSLWSDGLV